MREDSLSRLTDQELIIDLARVERAISSTDTYANRQNGAKTAPTVNPEMLALAEREQLVAAEIARRQMSPRDWAAYRCINLARPSSPATPANLSPA